jgi:two-component system, chemotaxis family, protein-glutamate methylesterase/glutaminase
VVALVSSTGGLRATSVILAALPGALPAAIIVLQHQQPDRPTVLPELLARHTALHVRVARDGAVLRDGVVEVAPPGYHTLVTATRHLSLVPSGDFPPHRPSADLLLTSLGLACGADAIAVVLTGGGNDGATGATVVHHHGGRVLAGDEATSEVFAMPCAAIGRGDVVDEVVPLERIGSRIAQLVLGR